MNQYSCLTLIRPTIYLMLWCKKDEISGWDHWKQIKQMIMLDLTNEKPILSWTNQWEIRYLLPVNQDICRHLSGCESKWSGQGESVAQPDKTDMFSWQPIRSLGVWILTNQRTQSICLLSVSIVSMSAGDHLDVRSRNCLGRGKKIMSRISY